MIQQSVHLCHSCEETYGQERKNRHKEYDIHKRNKDRSSFYNSKLWQYKRAKIKRRDNGICLLCFDMNVITSMDTVHHIIPLEEDDTQGLKDDNLICLCGKHHGRVHASYKKDKLTKEKVQKGLTGLVNKGWGV